VNLGCEEGDTLGVEGVRVRVVGPANCALNRRLVASVVGGKVFEQFVLAAKFAQPLEAVPDVGMSRDGRQRPAFAAADQYWDLVSRSMGQLGESVFDPGQSRIEEVQPGFDRSVVVTVDGVILFVPPGAEAERCDLSGQRLAESPDSPFMRREVLAVLQRTPYRVVRGEGEHLVLGQPHGGTGIAQLLVPNHGSSNASSV
jgi:hypothetical protein